MHHMVSGSIDPTRGRVPLEVLAETKGALRYAS